MVGRVPTLTSYEYNDDDDLFYASCVGCGWSLCAHEGEG